MAGGEKRNALMKAFEECGMKKDPGPAEVACVHSRSCYITAVSNLGPSCVLVPSCMVLPPNCMFVGQR